MSHQPHYLAWRDGFHRQPLKCACPPCRAAYDVGARRGDRTVGLRIADAGLVPDSSGRTSGDAAALTPEDP